MTWMTSRIRTASLAAPVQIPVRRAGRAAPARLDPVDDPVHAADLAVEMAQHLVQVARQLRQPVVLGHAEVGPLPPGPMSTTPVSFHLDNDL
ncbi:hypothetical protein BX283_4931 [Streptomyces sp. TLI_146]|nr:hypothetical protein BX283_4931 [Streptomyces sp. TLI_146]